MTEAFRRSYAIAVAMIAAAFFSIVLTPHADENAEIPDFEAMIPKEFGEWKMLDTPIAQANLVPQGGEDELFPYDAVLTRVYKNSAGEVVMLAMAYSINQKQERKIHRPELCYYGQGFGVRNLGPTFADVAGRSIPLHRLLARQRTYTEAVTYWIRIGDRIASGPWDTRLQLVWQGLKGNLVDGLLFRISSSLGGRSDPAIAYGVQQQFLAGLVGQLLPNQRNLLLGVF